MIEKSDYIRLMQQEEKVLIELAAELHILAPLDREGKLSIPKGTLVSLLLGDCPGCQKNAPKTGLKNRDATPADDVNAKVDRFNNRTIPVQYTIKPPTNKLFCENAIVISLARSKESRLDPFMEQNQFAGSLVVLDATDGAMMDSVPQGWAKMGGVGTYACLLSHIRAIEYAKENNFACVLIVEDDIRFADDFDKQLREAMSFLPDDWDMVWLAGADHVMPAKYNEKVSKLISTWGAYGYILRDTVYDFFLRAMSDKRMPCDDYYRREQINFNGFKTVTPLVKHVGKLSDRLTTTKRFAGMEKKVEQKYVLYINWHESKDALRRDEFLTCLDFNKQIFDRIVNVSDTPIEGTEFVAIEGRPTYNDFFALMNQGEVSVLSNLDIYFDETLKLKTPAAKQCFALTRWNVGERDEIIFFNRADSQDSWIFTNPPKKLIDADFTLGVAGCDNKIAFLLDQDGYNVMNPSATIKTFHLHNGDYRTYIDGNKVVNRVPPPYKILIPTE